jgi:DNA modification methylase
MQPNQILEGDCVKMLGDVKNAALAFADPPFNLDKSYAAYADDLNETDYADWSENWIRALVETLKPGGSLSVRHTDALSDNWKDLFASWPATGEDRKKLNNKPLKLKIEYKKLLDALQSQLVENSPK